MVPAFIIIRFSGISLSCLRVMPKRLKLGTLVDNGWMHRLYRNQAAAAYSSFYFSFFFLSNFQKLNFLSHFYRRTVRPRGLKLGTQMETGWMYRVYWNQAASLYLSLYLSFFFLSNFQTLKIFVTFFSGTARPRRLKLDTHVDNGWMYHVYRN